MDNKYIGIGILALLLILLGEKFPKIAIGIAGLILFGAVLFNIDKYKSLLEGGTNA